MTCPLSANEVLDREYLQIRAKILELAAAFDRQDRASGSVDGDPRLSLISESLHVLQGETGDRAEQIQLIFSRRYEDDSREKFKLDSVS